MDFRHTLWPYLYSCLLLFLTRLLAWTWFIALPFLGLLESLITVSTLLYVQVFWDCALVSEGAVCTGSSSSRGLPSPMEQQVIATVWHKWILWTGWNWLGCSWQTYICPKLKQLSLQIWPLKFEEESWKTKIMVKTIFALDSAVINNCLIRGWKKAS